MDDPEDDKSQLTTGIFLMAMIFCFGWVVRGLF